MGMIQCEEEYDEWTPEREGERGHTHVPTCPLSCDHMVTTPVRGLIEYA